MSSNEPPIDPERAAAWAAFQKHVGYPQDFEVFWKGWQGHTEKGRP